MNLWMFITKYVGDLFNIDDIFQIKETSVQYLLYSTSPI